MSLVNSLVTSMCGEGLLMIYYHQASEGGQLTFKRYSRREALPNLTITYQYRKRIKWPIPSLTTAGDLTKSTKCFRNLSIELITKIYHVLPSDEHKAIMFQIGTCL